MNVEAKLPQAVIGWIERDTPFAASPEDVRRAMESELLMLKAKRDADSRGREGVLESVG